MGTASSRIVPVMARLMRERASRKGREDLQAGSHGVSRNNQWEHSALTLGSSVAASHFEEHECGSTGEKEYQERQGKRQVDR